MHGLVLSYDVSFFFGQYTSVLQLFLSCEILLTFLRHESSHFELIPKSSVFLSCNSPLLSFDLKNSLLPCQGSCRLQGLEFVLTSCRTLLCPLAPACSSSSFFVPFSVSHRPNIFGTRSIFLTACQFFLPHRVLPNGPFSICPISLTSTWALYIVLAFSRTCCLFHTSCVDTC